MALSPRPTIALVFRVVVSSSYSEITPPTVASLHAPLFPTSLPITSLISVCYIAREDNSPITEVKLACRYVP